MLRGAIAAESKAGLMMNVHRETLSQVLAILPAMQKPTVSSLANDSDWVDVITVIDESIIRHIIPKLKAAGANSVDSPYEMGAVSMAHHIIRPTVTSFLDLAFEHKRKDIQMEEIPVSESSELVNVMLKDSGIRQKFNLIIIAIKNPDGEMMFNPSFEAVIQPDDTVIAVGEVDSLQKLELILNPRE